jgi:1,4-alpha-glucan branching enzyme
MRASWRLAVAALAAGASLSCAARPPATTAVTPDGVRFALARPEAASVAIAGNFNDWSTSSHPMSRSGSSGPWTAVVPLPPGEHTYMFVVNGTEWISPPLAEDYVDDGFGARNGVVVVRPDR